MDGTWCTDATSQEVIKKYVIKSWGHRARFHVTMLTNHDGYLRPFWTARSPKLDKKEKCFWWCMWHRAEFDLNVLFIHLRTRKMLFNALQFHFALQSGLKLDTRYSTRYSSIRIVKLPIFSHWKEALFSLKSWNKKWGSAYSFLW